MSNDKNDIQEPKKSPSISSTKDNNQIALEAEVSAAHRISKVWFIPIIALFIGSWMVFHTWSDLGPLITINFETAEGVEIGNTKIKLRDVTIGKVVDLKLNSNFDGIQITARLEKNTDKLLKSDTEFWVVKPRIGGGSVSGLSTLLSGAYIELSPGIANDLKSDFVGLENPPVTPLGTPGIRITLDSDSQTGLDIGDPIIFHGIKVGRVEFVYFNVEERTVYYDAFIESPYDKLVTTNTRFWRINGIEIDLSADGFHLNTGTIETLMGGGITFDVPANLPKGEIISDRAFFTIHDDKSDVLQKQFKNAQEFVLLFSQSIRGLHIGAPVEYKGVRIGTVVRTDIDYEDMGNLLDKKTRIPVLIQIEPARLGLKDNQEDVVSVKKEVSELIRSGMHGFISSGSLITGSKYIEIQYVPESSPHNEYFSGFQVIPTAASEIDSLLEKLDSILGTVSHLSLDKLVDNAGNAMAEMELAMVDFRKASERVDSFLDDAERENLISNVNKTLGSFERLARDFSEGSKTHQDIQNMIFAMEEMLKELTPVLSQINHQPNSLIFGGEGNDELEPKGERDDD